MWHRSLRRHQKHAEAAAIEIGHGFLPNQMSGFDHR
jgi:hypothetical protein